MGHLQHADFEHILSACTGSVPRVYIETGLWKGVQLHIASSHFDKCHGIELDAHWHRVAAERVADLEHVQVHHGDTRHILPRILADFPDTPLFVKLDAHFCILDPPIKKSPFPLWDELNLLRDRAPDDVVSIDDVHTFGVTRLDMRYKADHPMWEKVTFSSIRKFFGNRRRTDQVIAGGFVVWKTALADPPP